MDFIKGPAKSKCSWLHRSLETDREGVIATCGGRSDIWQHYTCSHETLCLYLGPVPEIPLC